LYLHGPAGCGKTHLVTSLFAAVARSSPSAPSVHVAARDLVGPLPTPPDAENSAQSNLGDCELLVVEDVQYLPARAVELLVQVFDEVLARQGQMIFTASAGPRYLDFPSRLTSRLACGLVVGLEPLQTASRLAVLEDRAQRRQLAVSRDVLAWLAEHLVGGGRQLEGALSRLEMLARMQQRPLDVDTVAGHFHEQADAAQPTVERIAERVGGYFQIPPRQLQSERRCREVLLPRQVGMYLARQLTELSLEEIGAYFGGRDHSTVLHSVRKVEQALIDDAVLCGTVRQLRAGLQ
jgi:chromosomal replication initiator protein